MSDVWQARAPAGIAEQSVSVDPGASEPRVGPHDSERGRRRARRPVRGRRSRPIVVWRSRGAAGPARWRWRWRWIEPPRWCFCGDRARGTPAVVREKAARGRADVLAAGRTHPLEVAIRDVPDAPSRVVLEVVVGGAEMGEIVVSGGAAFRCPVVGVIHVAADRGARAAGESAGLVSHLEPGSQVGRDPVAGAVHVENGAGDGVRQQPGERRCVTCERAGGVGVDRPVPIEGARGFGPAEESEHGHRDVHGRADPGQARAPAGNADAGRGRLRGGWRSGGGGGGGGACARGRAGGGGGSRAGACACGGPRACRGALPRVCGRRSRVAAFDGLGWKPMEEEIAGEVCTYLVESLLGR
jgi:hypothetical protein